MIRSPAEVISIRHGESKYTEQFPDLTDEGIRQIRQTARRLEQRIKSYDTVRWYSSPAVRARGSASVFAQELGLDLDGLQIVEDLRPFDIHRFKEYMAFNNTQSTNLYGEMWITNPLLQRRNDLIEHRPSVEKRSHKALRRILAQVYDLAAAGNGNTVGIVFSHFETNLPYLHALHTDHPEFPIHQEQPPQNAEEIILGTNDPRLRRLTVEARGSTVNVVHEVRYLRPSRFRRI
jgi:broad specificity phosphatase PhoE